MSKKKRRGGGKAPRKATPAVAKEEQDASQGYETQMQMAKLKIDSSSAAQNQNHFDEDAFLDEAIKLAAAEASEIEYQWINGCDHGMVHEKRILEFVHAFKSAFVVEANRTGVLIRAYLSAHAATSKKYADVMFDLAKVKKVVSYFLSEATEAILGGYNIEAARGAGWHASFVCYFEHHIAGGLQKHKIAATLTTTKMFELHVADDNDRALISFLKRRISCSCLDDKYRDVKSLPKMGLCYNKKCPLPKRKAERSKMFCCTRCGLYSYCSSECQKVDWPDHKYDCNCYYLQRQREKEGENNSWPRN